MNWMRAYNNISAIPQSKVTEQILLILLYFKVFDHPLTLNEIKNHLNTESSKLDTVINSLVKEKKIYQHSQYFSTKPLAKQVAYRQECNQRAIQKLPLAQKYSKVLASIPFIKAICLSGSISKGVMHQDSDIDYFIIAQSGKVWLTKLFIVLYRILFLFNTRKHFCANYIIDENHLEIDEKNRFTATEIVSMIPTYGYETYIKLKKSNSWVNDYFPNHKTQTNQLIIQSPDKTFFQKLILIIFDNTFGQWLGRQFMNWSWKRYQQKFKNQLSPEWLEIAFKTTPYVSKSHGPNFQKVVSERFAQNIEQFEKEHQIKFENVVF